MITYNKKDIPEHLQKYFEPAELGLEKTPEEYVAKMVEVFREVKRVLKKDGTCWLNLGDSYAGSGCGTNDYRTGKSRSINKTDIMFCKKPPQQRFGRQGRTSTVSKLERGRGYYNSEYCKPKDLVGIPWMVAFALRANGWYLRQDLIWSKPNPMPESVQDRCTKSHEYIFLLSKSQKYYFDNEAIKEVSTTNEDRPFGIIRDRVFDYDSKEKKLRNRTRKTGEGQNTDIGRKGCCGDNGFRNKRSVWTVTTKPFKGAHFATFPEKIPELCIKAGSKESDTILDPFGGSGTTADVAKRLGRKCISIELNPDYCKLHLRRWPNQELF